MIDLENLRTASLYINNQLLSRGLLRDGQTIEFTDPEADEGGVAATMGRIMGIVNDLILRRDRDAEHRESLSTALRTLRAENLRQTSDVARLREKNAETQRRVELGEAAENALRNQLKVAETTVRSLKDEAAKARTLVAQTRNACATEVRRRDRQIDALKKQLGEAGRARGSTRNPAVTVISVTGDVGAEDQTRSLVTSPARAPAGSSNMAEETYDLRNETNAFLAELARELSQENESLQDLVKTTFDRLRDMSGWDADGSASSLYGSGGDGHGMHVRPDCERIAADMDALLEHLRTILTNPSFVPIEEVEQREDEIGRLKSGWVQMESRWKEAVHLIDGWRRRMATSGRPVNIEELKMGLRLSPVRVKDVAETAQGLGLKLESVREDEEEEEEDQEEQHLRVARESPCFARESLHLVPAPDFEMHIDDDGEDSDSDSDASIYQDDLEIDELEASEPNVQVLGQSEAIFGAVDPSSPPLPPAPQLSPLKECATAGNRGAAAPRTTAAGAEKAAASRPARQRPGGDHFTIAEERTRQAAATNEKTKKSAPTQTKAPTRPAVATRRPVVSRPTVKPVTAAAEKAGAKVVKDATATFAPADSSSSLDSVLLVKPPPAVPTPPIRTERERPPSRVQYDSRTEREAKKALGSEPQNDVDKENQKPHREAKAQASNHTVAEARPSKPAVHSVEDLTAPKPSSITSTTSNSTTASATTGTILPHQQQQQAPALLRSPKRGGSRLPLPANPPPQQSPLTMATIAAKLAASERDADAARVRAKLKAARGAKLLGLVPAATSSGSSSSSSSTCDANSSTGSGGAAILPVPEEAVEEEDLHEPVKRKVMAVMPPPVSTASQGSTDQESGRQAEQEIQPQKRKRERRVSKVASRRRSTLSPWELESLISGNVNVPATPVR